MRTSPEFRAFINTEIGLKFWIAAQRAALEVLRNGRGRERKGRFSPRTYIASYRQAHRVRINDHFSADLATALISVHPQLAAIIETRRRTRV